MNRKIVWRNLAGNKAVSFATVLFTAAAAALISLAAVLAASLSGAVGQLMTDAATPHFMQMHAGEPEPFRLREFARENSDVADYQILNFLNIDGAQIRLGERSLAESLQDNGFCTQSRRFDFLLDLNSKPIQPRKGELFVPVCYLKDGTVKAGDRAEIGGRPFTVAGFVRDSQMNSSLASSKRFLVSEADYQMLEPFGKVEYLIEFRLHSLSRLSAFEAAYSAAKLPANGPALTWPLFRMVSAVSDGIMIAVIIMTGILMILMALLCVRFTLLAKIEDDYREIGVLRAIGMRVSDIGRIYLAIYAAIAALGSALGFLLSLLLQGPMQRNIRLNLGGGGNPHFLMPGLAGAALVFLLILLFVKLNLRRFRGISAVQAIRFGAVQDPGGGSGIMKLSGNRLLSANAFLGIKDVLSRKRLYSTMLAVIVLASFIMIVPQNLYHTVSGREFVTYLGVGRCDLRLDIQQTSRIDEKAAEVGNYMAGDEEIADYALFTAKTFAVKREDGRNENIRIELGDHTVFPLQYTAGRAPVSETEIALSVINAEELGKTLGEQIMLVTADGEKPLTVCGIYSDITNGGKTAKAAFSDDSADIAWSLVCASLTSPDQAEKKISEYADRFRYAKISSIDEYMAQTFGQTLQSIRTAALAAVLAAVAVTLLVTLLFMKLLAAKDRYSIAVMRAAGFRSADIRRQYAWRAVFVLAAGIVLGTLLAGTLGEKIAAAAVSSAGAAAFRFTVDPLSAFILSPLIMLLAALTATVWGTFGAGEVRIYESMKE